MSAAHTPSCHANCSQLRSWGNAEESAGAEQKKLNAQGGSALAYARQVQCKGLDGSDVEDGIADDRAQIWRIIETLAFGTLEECRETGAADQYKVTRHSAALVFWPGLFGAWGIKAGYGGPVCLFCKD